MLARRWGIENVSQSTNEVSLQEKRNQKNPVIWIRLLSLWSWLTIPLSFSNYLDKPTKTIIATCRSHPLKEKVSFELKRPGKMTETVEFRLEQVQTPCRDVLTSLIVPPRAPRSSRQRTLHPRGNPRNYQKKNTTRTYFGPSNSHKSRFSTLHTIWNEPGIPPNKAL